MAKSLHENCRFVCDVCLQDYSNSWKSFLHTYMYFNIVIIRAYAFESKIHHRTSEHLQRQQQGFNFLNDFLWMS